MEKENNYNKTKKSRKLKIYQSNLNTLIRNHNLIIYRITQTGRHSICNSNHVIVNHLIIFVLRIEYGNHLIIRLTSEVYGLVKRFY